MTQNIEDFVPVVQLAGLNTQKNASFGGTLSVTGNVTIAGTLTGNKTPVTAYTTTQILTAAQSGSIILFNAAAGFTITLPAPVIGLSFSFGVQTSVTSSNHKVITDVGTTFIAGGVAMGEAAGTTTLEALFNGSSHISILMNGTTTGGLIGTFFNMTCISSTVWYIEGIVAGSGTLATPASNS